MSSSSNTTPSIGVLGLGIIGGTWARHYHDAGRLAGAWNRTAKPDFPQWQDEPAAVTRAADVVQIVVADPPAVQSVIDAILPELGPGKTVIQSSTIDPDSSDKFKVAVIATGARYLEAPFTGSKPAAEAKQSVYYLGGTTELCDELDPLLALGSAHRIRIGDNRQACTLKLAMNLRVSVQMQVLAESLEMCRRSGIDDDTYFGALKPNITYSGLDKLKEPQLRHADFAPLFSVKHMHKDMRLAASMDSTADLELLKTIRTQLAAAENAGFGDEDFAALAKLFMKA
ncbi:NAD(P)-dependent oxidoreductase [Actomonas aquatica]|uniref:NAD(P)-dependent oxidoreductase n=1 Tax=Actomonas aquatica TaxID=2866162 RepID=A0ABZ1C731_9BACT|nr:NAD(P)-dependent oxidoreductase [Opitutus sp. WL0086]WRQ87394.1 NAD(P)-dependent oxidoreductase [Opitutus sp. WL0086]